MVVSERNTRNSRFFHTIIRPAYTVMKLIEDFNIFKEVIQNA